MSIEQQDRWDAANTVRHTIKYNKHTDADILEWLERQPSKAGAVKAAIRDAIRKENK